MTSSEIASSSCSNNDEINSEKLTMDSHFVNELGLLSLDHVKAIMFKEDESGFEIPDMNAVKLMQPVDIVHYVVDREDVHE